MANRSELKLAEWSEWERGEWDREVVIEHHTPTDVEIVVDRNWLWIGSCNCRPANALAAIRAVDVDPEYIERNRLREFLFSIGYDAAAVERVCSGNEIESDYICPQTLNMQVELDSCRSENEALIAHRNALQVTLAVSYDKGFYDGIDAAEKSLGLNCTRAVEHENPYRNPDIQAEPTERKPEAQ